MTRIDGSTALVTGGQRGLGEAYVEALLRRGAKKVYATARKPTPSTDPRVETLSLEVTDQDSVTGLAARAGDVNIVINNAGVLPPETLRGLLGSDMSDIVATFETNVFGALRVARSFAPILAANGGGALVDMHSVVSWAAGAAAYGASKAAFWSVTNSLRLELAEQKTQVVGVHLGFADTDMVAGSRGTSSARRRSWRRFSPASRRGEPKCSSTRPASISRPRWRGLSKASHCPSPSDHHERPARLRGIAVAPGS
jgi:NAD(P)-dependent dehydrogenase (short-subunit alcohol dehydrogenase family)